MAPLPCAGGQLWSPLYRRACARGWCATMVSSRQGMSVSKEASKEAGSVSLHGCLDIGGSNDQLHLKIARLLRSPRAPLQRRLWPEGWWRLRICSLPLGPCQLPSCGCSFSALPCSLSSGQRPHSHALIMPMPSGVGLSPGTQPFLLPGSVHLQCAFTPLILLQLHVTLIILLVCP